MTKPFWKSRPADRQDASNVFGWLQASLAEHALMHGETLQSYYKSGSLKEDVKIEHYVNELKQLGFTDYLHSIPRSRSDNESWLLVTPESAVEIIYGDKARTVSINVWTLDTVVMGSARTSFGNVCTRRVTKGRAFVVVTGNAGPYLYEMGTAGEDFEPSNYRPEVVNEYKHITDDLNSADPCGRIVLLDGPPGTGKTHMVRALMNSVPLATFVIVPSNMIAQLGAPSFITALLDEQRKGQPMVLIIEDADEAIASRKSDNVSEISALLNFSDGIFGALLDMRIVATTNVDVEALDNAVMRPGRLCRRIEVGKLDADQAQAVYARLGGKGVFATKGNFYTLGEVYASVRGPGSSQSHKKPKGRLGFQPEEEEQLTPAEQCGMKPGEVATTDTGDVVKVRSDGQFEMVELSPPKPDDDLIDEDPEETPVDLDDEDDDD